MKLIVTKWNQGVGVFGFENNTLMEANVYDNKQKICIGDIYLGRINKILPNINACFVQIGEKEEVFLPSLYVGSSDNVEEKFHILF